MNKFILALLLLISMLQAKVVIVHAQGVFESQKHAQTSHTPEQTRLARDMALAYAKDNASREAGTTIYSSSSAYSDSKGKNTSKSTIEAISSSIIKYKITSEGWNDSKYIVKIKATVDSKDAQEIFMAADERLNKILELQKSNKDILEKLTATTDYIKNLNRNKYTTENSIDLIDYDLKIFSNYKYQARLLSDLQDNTVLMVSKFNKGTLLEIANKNDRTFEKYKELFDNDVVREFRRNFIVKILNVDVVRHGDTADINFLIAMKMHNNHRGGRMDMEWKAGIMLGRKLYQNGLGNSTIIFNRKGSTSKLKEWVAKNRNFVIKVNIGNRVYITERVAYYSTAIFSPQQPYMSGNYSGGYVIFNNKNAYATHRTIKDIPIEELADMDEMRATLAFSSFDIQSSKKNTSSDLPLPVVREGSEFY